MSYLLLGEDELRQTIGMVEAVDAVESAFIASAKGRMNLPAVFDLDLSEVNGTVQVQGTYQDEAPYYAIKIDNIFLDNPSINLPVHSEVTLIFDAATGFLAAIMQDHGYLTRIRAGVTGAIAAKYLANEKIEKVAVIGSGDQAYIQLKMLMTVRNIQNLSVWGRSPMNVDTYARRLIEEHDLNIEIAPSIQAAVNDADLIITATSSKQPLIKAEWLKPGVHINAMGSNSPAKQELHSDVLKRADMIVTDSVTQSSSMGEIYHALNAGAITKDDIHGELGDVVAKKISGRTHPDQITIADLTGRTMQDFAIAVLALEKALFLELGRRL
jgi:ornithine cyclodeaminase